MLKVYYNNKCSVCRIEINHYIRKNTKNIQWIDISNNQEAERELNKNASQLLRRLHIKHDNEVYEGCRMTVLIQNRNSVHFIPRQCGAKIYENGFCKIHNEAFNCINKNFSHFTIF